MQPHLKALWTFAKHIAHRYQQDGCGRSAAALTYTSLFAVVPLLTVMYATLSMVPAVQTLSGDVESLLFENLVPASGQEVQAYLQQFSQQARKLTGVGIGLLLVTAIMMLKTIETTFNQIWRTRSNRQGLSSFLLYWAMLSLGPLCLVLAMGITTYLLSLEIFADSNSVLGFGTKLLGLAPYLLTATAFTLLFAAVPNCRVPLKHAALGGLVTALCFETAKSLFTGIVANSSFQFIYGTFAAIPLFLMWIYMSWLIVLAGAEFVQALNNSPLSASRDFDDLTLSLALLELLARRHREGRELSEHELTQSPWLFDRYSLQADRWPALRDKLFDERLIRLSEAGHYTLGRDLKHYTLWQLLKLLDKTTQTGLRKNGSSPWYQALEQRLNDSAEQARAQLDRPLAQLFEEPIEGPRAAPVADREDNSGQQS